MGQFHLVYFTVTGQQISQHVVDYQQMISTQDGFERKHIPMFEQKLASDPSNFRSTLPPGNYPVYYKTHGHSAAEVSIGEENDPEMVLIGVLASGLDNAEDAAAIQAVQKLIVTTFHGTQYEPAFDVSHQSNRPLAAALVSFDPARPTQSHLYSAYFTSLACAFFHVRGVV